jgi:hypothetical protein
MTNDDIRFWLPWMVTLLGTLIVVVSTAWLNTRAVLSKFDVIDNRFDGRFNTIGARFGGIDKRLDSLDEDLREIRSDVKLLTGKISEFMAQKG